MSTRRKTVLAFGIVLLVGITAAATWRLFIPPKLKPLGFPTETVTYKQALKASMEGAGVIVDIRAEPQSAAAPVPGGAIRVSPKHRGKDLVRHQELWDSMSGVDAYLLIQWDTEWPRHAKVARHLKNHGMRVHYVER